ncbi:protein giant-like [Sitodiplosis mosellana]|uniref:protein giant-like n=1 Tax=Sitodiplosis mosellana TaxID=263140 RepID=UPI002443DEA9|nr:protein giant-like [Sitodiplosis mosellana]
MNNSYMDTSDSSDNPIDLSRRCDSVETRKTPSPYNSSSFVETSPSLENDSPTSNSRKKALIRSDTPPNCYQSTKYIQREYSTSSQGSSRYPYAVPGKRSPPSPKATSMHHFMHEQAINSNEDEINPYIMHAVALQQKLQSIPASVSASAPSSPESGSSSQYPMMLGRDGKMARPFKAYPRDPLSNPFASIPTSDSLTDRMSAERFNVFRQQMLEQIHAANGGRPTITNPKMRRSSAKNFNDSEQNSEIEFSHQIDVPSQPVNCPSDSSEGNTKKPLKDNAYFERRRKNNAAAKKSRDRRRIKEDEIAIRAAYLERENMELKIELATTKRQLAQFVPS